MGSIFDQSFSEFRSNREYSTSVLFYVISFDKMNQDSTMNNLNIHKQHILADLVFFFIAR